VSKEYSVRKNGDIMRARKEGFSMISTFKVKHESCGREVQVNIKGLGSERRYEGYCTACGGEIFGFFLTEETDKPRLSK
jgi:hypothetical protein